MKTSNLTVSEGSHINNLTIPSGTAFPTNGNTGELFYPTTGAVGVYCLDILTALKDGDS